MSTCTSEAGGCAPSSAWLGAPDHPAEGDHLVRAERLPHQFGGFGRVGAVELGRVAESLTALACRSRVKPLRSRPKSATCGRPLAIVTVVGAYCVVVRWPPGAT